MSGPRLSTGALLLAAACSATVDLKIELIDSDRDCDDVFPQVTTLSIEVIATAGRCRLEHECASDVKEKSLAGFKAALRGPNAQALLELDADEAQVLVLNGRPGRSCFPADLDGELDPDEAMKNHPVLCAYANFDDAHDGLITLDLQADSATAECPESMKPCP